MTKNANNFTNLFYLNPTPTLIYELQSLKILAANNAAIVLYKYTEEEFLKLNIKKISITKELELLNISNDGLNDQNKNIPFGTCTHQTKRGELIYLDINGHTIDFEDKKCLLILCQSSSIHENKKSKSDLMMDASLDVFCIVNEQDKFEFVSKASFNLWGYLPEELIGISIHDLIFEDDNVNTTQKIATIREGQEIKSFVNRYKKKDGSLAYNLWSAKLDVTTKLRYAVAKDYKEKVEQEEKLIRSEQRFKALVQEGSDLIVLLDARGKYVYLNPTNKSYLGFQQEEFLGKNALEFIHPDDSERAKLSLQQLATKNRVILEPYRFKNNKNEWRWIETVLTNLLENPAVKGIVANSRDVTEEKWLKELNQKVGEMAKIGSWEADLLYDKLYWSDEVHQLHETDAKLFVPNLQNAINFYREDFRELVQLNIEETISTGKIFEFEAVLVTSKNKELWVRAIGNAEFQDGKCVRIFGGFQDISEQKSVANKLEEALKDKNKILESIGDGFFAVDNDWIVTYWNKKAELVLDKKKELIVGKHLWAENAGSIDTDLFLECHKVMKTGQAAYFESYYAPVDKWLGVSAYPSEVGIVVYFIDVSSTKQASMLLQKANERFEKVTEATNDAIWDWNLTDKTYYRSKGIEKFFGKGTSKSFTDDKFWKDNFHPEDSKNLQNSMAEAINNPLCHRWELEYRIFNEEQKIIHVSDCGIIIRDSQGIATRMIGAMTNISEQKQLTFKLNELNQSLQQHTFELEQSNEELEQFAFVASHDLQEPLRMIASFMDLLQRKYGNILDEKGHQYINFAISGAKRMQQIILDLLEYAKASKALEDKEQIDINDVISDFSLLRKKLISEKKALIIAVHLPKIHTYEVAITQIIHCLVDNALKYTAESKAPVIEIKVAEHELEWEFSIKDNGIGIEAQFFSKIFIIFQRLHNKEDYAGTGIGLSIAKKHVEFLGGRIWLESNVGVGTTFFFTIAKN